jgi:hypothetical protein
MAEEEGFEPPDEFPRQRFSRPPVSTTHPFLHQLSYRISSFCVCHTVVLGFLAFRGTTATVLSQVGNRPRFRIVIAVRVPNGRGYCRMPQQFLHRHKVHAGARQPQGERMPERVPGDAGQPGASRIALNPAFRS